jgi:hypothetical protein
MLLHYSTHKSSIHTIRSSPTTNLPQLSATENFCNLLPLTACKRASVTHINPWSDTRETLLPRCFNCCVTLETRDVTADASRDHSPLLRHQSVYSCCLATNEARRCATRHGTAELVWARRKHRFVYCCVIAGTCFDVIVLAWRKYTTVYFIYYILMLYSKVVLFKCSISFLISVD